ncbi:hypothetical protein [Clostridium tertium]|uniref:hypothetical protein n=1 Tax=Clostridium tertium TaxID=1559 RepID=UPI0023B357FC|nr:hypothetical protein [Clostridium tertium]
MDMNTHVYCTDCANWNKLYNSLMSENNNDIPGICEKCSPCNPEDSTPLKERPNYIEK